MKKYIGLSLIILFSLSGEGFAQLDSDYATMSIALPTGQESSSALLLEKTYPKKGRVGQAYEYNIKVTNLTHFDLQSISVSEVIPADFEIIKTLPKYDRQEGDRYTWRIGSLDARDYTVITVSGKSMSKKASPCCTTADYEVPAICHKTLLEDPSLAVSVKAPRENLLCDTIPLEFTVRNTGDSNLTDVMVRSALPLGVSTKEGRDLLFLKAGSLAPGESRRFKEYTKANQVGSYTFNADAQSDDISAVASTQKTKVFKPSIRVETKVNRKQQFIGRDLVYTIEVKNTSGIEATELVVRTTMPEHTAFKSASNNGRLVTGNAIEWLLGTLDGFDSQEVQFEVKSTGFGQAQTRTSAKASCCDASSDAASASFVGIPALLLEVVDLVDPIEVGDIETYEIRVTNQGTAPAHNIVIKAQLEGMSYVSDSGETRSSDTAGGSIEFNPVYRLESKESASWSIKVSGDRAGDLRFRVLLMSDELTRPVEEAESTFVY